MAYSDHFTLTDDLIRHLDPVLVGLNDPFIESRYTGFLAVSAVTVLELALKTIFIDFSSKKHTVLANFCDKYFEKINGRIGLKTITEQYILSFGIKYQLRFIKRLEAIERAELKSSGSSIKSSFGSLIAWRNSFAHEGTVPPHVTYKEVKQAYEYGKKIMDCLATCMRY